MARKLEFENGVLVKVDGMRPDYMDGHTLIRLVKELGAALNEINHIVYANPTLSREDYFKVRFLATTASKEGPQT